MEIRFESLIKELFPSITESTKEQIKSAIKQFNVHPQLLYQSISDETIYQGDIIKEIQFVTLISYNKYSKKTLSGMLISNTCDYVNRELILIAPIYPFNYIKDRYKNRSFVESLKMNTIYDKFYLPNYKKDNDYVVDFSGINSVKADYLLDSIKNNKITKIMSLSQYGFYFFLTKLTVYLMRREAPNIIREKPTLIN